MVKRENKGSLLALYCDFVIILAALFCITKSLFNKVFPQNLTVKYHIKEMEVRESCIALENSAQLDTFCWNLKYTM